MNPTSIAEGRATWSQIRLAELRRRLSALPELVGFPALTIFGAGSYARLEASKYSDIDMFFLDGAERGTDPEPRTKSLRLFGKIIEIVDTMNFPKFSNDCEYLVLLHTSELVTHLGGRTDDHGNYFTARMLLLLESHCLHGDSAFADTTKTIIASYFKDFPDHKYTFLPVFLLNDICRFWKTLLLNYENKRNPPPGMNDQARQTRQKVRNFKLKYSRMTTCFASIAALGSHLAPVTEEQVFALTQLTPSARLLSIAERIPACKAAVEDVIDKYSWFLEKTALPTAELEDQFSDVGKRAEMSRRANEYGDVMYRLLGMIDDTDPNLKLLRNLAI